MAEVVETLRAGRDTYAETVDAARELEREYPGRTYGIIARPHLIGEAADRLPRSTSPWLIVERRVTNG